MTFGSLFSGIGGIDLGLERAGMRCLWQVEKDPYASLVLRKNWSDVPNLGDITNVDWSQVPKPDLLAGGFPCQDISVAGKGAGINGSRSGLWREFARAIRELRPRFVLVENVPALLVRGMGTVLGGLAELGYDAEWQMLSAQQFGAPHLRRRLFIFAYLANTSGIRHQRQEKAICTRRDAVDIGSQDMANTMRQGLAQWQTKTLQTKVTPIAGSGWWVVEPDVGRVADGIPARVDRLRCLGNAVVPQIAEWLGVQILKFMEETTCSS